MTQTIRARLAALVAVGGLAATGAAQVPLDPVPPPAVPVAPADPVPAVPCPPKPRVIEWPGGSVTLGPEVIVRQAGVPGRSTTVVTGAGNGFGNSIVIDNGGAGGVTIVRNARNGVGNRLVLDPEEEVFDLGWLGWTVPAPAAQVAPARVYRGKGNAFWAQKQWSDAHDCNLYWSQADRAWYRYHADEDAYRPLPTRP